MSCFCTFLRLPGWHFGSPGCDNTNGWLDCKATEFTFRCPDGWLKDEMGKSTEGLKRNSPLISLQGRHSVFTGFRATAPPCWSHLTRPRRRSALSAARLDHQLLQRRSHLRLRYTSTPLGWTHRNAQTFPPEASTTHQKRWKISEIR